MNKIKQLKKEFLDYQNQEKNRTEKTIENYNLYLDKFLNWYDKDNPKQITKKTAQRYKQWLSGYTDKHGEKIKINTQNYHLIALRSFLRYLCKLDINTLDPSEIKLKEIPDKKISFLDKKDIEHLLESPKIKKEESKLKQKRSLRDKAILALLVSNGLKVSQLSQTKKKDVSNQTLKISDPHSKQVVLPKNTKDRIKKYLSPRSDSNPYLFISHDNRTNSTNSTKYKGISPRSVQRLVKKYSKAIGISVQVTPNVLRNSCILHLLAIVDDIPAAQRYLGHKTITTTRHYKHLANRKLDRSQSIFDDKYGDIVDKIIKNS